MDVVIPVRQGEENEELRYALRSLRLLEGRERVWVAGYRPAWCAAAHAPKEQRGTKHENSLGNLLRACANPRVSNEFVLWADDLFQLEPAPPPPQLHCGTVGEFLDECRRRRLGESAYVQGLRATAEALAKLGVRDPLCFELHVPIVLRKRDVLDAVELATAAHGPPGGAYPQVRTLAANLFPLGLPARAEDVKVHSPYQAWEPGPLPWVSTSNEAWNPRQAAVKLVKRLHQEPSPWEVK